MATRTINRPDINKLTLNAYARAVQLDANGNHWISASEVAANHDADRADFKTLFDAALKTRGTTSAVKTGDLYAEAKKAVAEIRKVADTRGNKDGQLQPGERKYLSKEARALTRYAPVQKTPPPSPVKPR